MSKQKSIVYNNFVEEEDNYRCNLLTKNGDQCSTHVKKCKASGVTTNLKNHLKRFHEQQFKIVQEEDTAAKKTKKPRTDSKMAKITDMFKHKSATVSITEDALKLSVLKMIVNNGVPLTHFKGEGFQLLAGKAAVSLGIHLGRSAVRALLMNRFQSEKEALKGALKGKHIYLLFDGVTRLRRHFLGVSVQFLDNDDKLQVKTLALLDTDSKGTSEETKDMVLEIVEDYGIELKMVLACVVDNASAMSKTVMLLNQAAIDGEKERAGEDDEGEDDEGEDDEGEDEESEVEEVDIDGDEYQARIEEIADDFGVVHHMRCMEHSLQLAVRDGLKSSHTKRFLGKIRSMATTLRQPKKDAVIKRKTGLAMLIDMETRWGSTFLMVKRLLRLKETVIEFDSKDLELYESQWEKI